MRSEWTVHRGIAARGHVRSPAAYHPVISTYAIPQSLAVMYTLSAWYKRPVRSTRARGTRARTLPWRWRCLPGPRVLVGIVHLWGRVAKTVQPGFTRVWPGMGEYPT